MGSQKCRRSVQGSGQRRRSDDGSASPGLQKSQLIVPADLIFNSDPPIKLNQIGAATKQHVLTVVYDLTGGRMLIRGGPSAKVSAAFEERDAESAVGEGRTGGQSRQTTSDHGYVWSLCPGLGHQARRLRKPFPKM